jgi:hypothetical protein
MNCKPGDLAVIVRSQFRADLIGLFVEVLHAAPMNTDFDLPNGQAHSPLIDGRFRWVCKFMQPVKAPHGLGSIQTVYAPIPDECLRPIRDQPGEDETIRIAGLPCETKQPELTT